VHPGHDAVVVQLGDGGVYDLFGGEQVAEAQLAILENRLDFGGGVGRSEAQRGEATRFCWRKRRAMPGARRRGRAALPEAG